MTERNPTIQTAQDVKAFAHNLQERVKERNLDIRSLSITKFLHVCAEAKDYDNWQQYSADLKKHECINALTTFYKYDRPNAEAAWNTLSVDDIKAASSGCELAEKLGHTYAQVPQPKSKQTHGDRLNKAILSDLLELNRGESESEETIDDSIYGQAITGYELVFVLGSASSLHLTVDKDRRVSAGRIETRGWDVVDTLDLTSDQIVEVEELFETQIDAMF